MIGMIMGRKVVFRADAGICGTDAAEGFIFPDGTTNEQLDAEAWQFGLNHAESYGIHWSADMVNDEDQDEDGDQYSDAIEGWWEEYDPEEHDGLITFGYATGPVFNDLT